MRNKELFDFSDHLARMLRSTQNKFILNFQDNDQHAMQNEKIEE